jgi:23S rRNA (uracil1939-C5)-methyltransferase
MSTEFVEVTIERILPGGLSLAHAEGRTLMVALAAPGDRLRVRIDRVKGNVSFAQIHEIITPSPFRIEPPCPYFGRCGGCDFQQLTYEAQLEAKKEIIRDCLRRIGGIESLPDFSITPAPQAWHYRARAQWQYDAIRQRLGYFESNSRRVCDVAECAVLVPRLQEILTDLRRRMVNNELPEDARDFRAVVGDDVFSIAPPVPVVAPTVSSDSESRGSSPTVREGLDPAGEDLSKVTRTTCGETYRFNAESFFQANVDLLPQLIDATIDQAAGESAVELYCGVGLFTVPLARRFRHVVGVESDFSAATFAQTNLENAGLANGEIAKEDVGHWLEDNAARWLNARSEFGKLDYLLLDPPRTGAESRVIAGILRLHPQKLCYVSCDPATLARDLKKLIAGGYTLDSLHAFDMFPQTHHVETVVHLSG